MKLYRISRTDARDPLEMDKGPRRDDAIQETIALFADVLLDTLQRNDVKGLYISRFRGGATSPRFKSHQSVHLSDIPELVRLNVTSAIYTKVRDGTCRFIDFGDDYLINLCLRHEDDISIDRWTDQGVVIQDMSRLLIETDAYDF